MDDRVRTAEVMASACLATDLGMGFPFEHGLHATLMTMRLAELLDVDPDVASQTYYASLLMYSGCTTDAQVSSRIFGGSMTEHVTPVQFGTTAEIVGGVVRALPDVGARAHERPFEIARRLPMAARFRGVHFTAMCEVATMLAERLGVPPSVPPLFRFLTERWDGKGVLRRARGEDIPLPLRIVHVARDAAFQHVIGGRAHAVATIRSRGGHAFDPDIAHRFADHAEEILHVSDAGSETSDSASVWGAVLDAEPRPWLSLDDVAIDGALAALGDFADLASPTFAGHSAGVAALAASTAAACGFAEDDVTTVRRAAHLHDVGRAAVHPRIWQKPGRLTADAWEQVRLHAYHSERVLARSPFLARLATVGCAHHERLDGSGYHRGLTAASLSPPARLVAVADVFHALQEPRPHRGPVPAGEAARVLEEAGRSGQLDPVMVSAVLADAGHRPPRIEHPAGLTEREVEVLGLLTTGLQTKQVARALGISPKTVDRHIQHAYRKAGVSTRAGATLFAMEHGLVPWGGLPIPRSAGGS